MVEHFSVLCNWLENDGDSELYTLAESRHKMIKLTGSPNVYSDKRLKQKLELHYGNHIYFAELNGKQNILCFRSMANYVLHRTWYAERKENVEDEAKRIVEAAAKLIRTQLQSIIYHADIYPSDEDIQNMEKGLNLLPPLLLLMLKTLVPNVKQQISIGQCITKAAKPRSFLPPVLFVLGVEMDHMFGSRWLIDELFRLEFSVSYNEVNRFRQAVVQSESIEQLLPETFPGSFSQSVADNVDHNLASIDCCGSFHGMGVMVISTPTKNSTVRVASQNAIKRIKTVRSKELVANKGIPIKFYQVGLKSALSSFVMRPTVELRIPYTLPG